MKKVYEGGKLNINKFPSDFVKQFFTNLNKDNIRYAVLRNYELLPEDNDSKDVDIIVEPAVINEVVVILKETAQDNGYQLIWVNELDYLEGFVFVKIDGSNVYSIKLDIFNGFKWRGCSYINHNVILNSTIEYNGFKVPLKAHEAFIMIVYYVLYAKGIKSKYLEKISTNANNNINDFKKIIELTFQPKLAKKIIDLVKINKIEELVSLRAEIRSNVISNNYKNKNILSSFIEHIKTEYWSRNKFGTMITFSGPDGAGKSTLVDAVMDVFYSLGINGSKTPHHFLTTNVPSLHKLPCSPAKHAKQDYTKPYQAKTAGVLSSIIRTIYYYFAFFLDRIVFVKKDLRGNQIVVFDRYYIDIIADPTRIRIGLKKSLIQKVFSTLPSPDFTFVVLADKEHILSRKNELTEDKLVELLKEYSSLPNIISNCSVLYNNSSIDEGKKMICQYVFDKLEERYK